MTDSLTPGVYILRNVKSNTVIDVKDGSWDHGRVQGWNVDDINQNPDDLVNQRFLISPNPEFPEAVNLLCLRAGAYLRCRPELGSQTDFSCTCCLEFLLNDEAESVDSAVVFAQATCSQSSHCLWVPEMLNGKEFGLQEEVYRFRPFDDEKLLLSIEGGSSANGAAVLASPEVLDDGTQQCWKLERTDMDSVAAASWMSRVSSHTKLGMLSIPGTHQSLALNKAGRNFLFTDNPRCQDHSPLLQLCNGIRYLDLRLDLYSHRSRSEARLSEEQEEPYLIARHGNRAVFYVWEGYALSAMLQSLSYFLSRNQAETVLVSLRLESGRDADQDRWVHRVYEELQPWKSLFYYINDERVFADLSLQDCRGKAILFSNDIRGGIKPIDDVGHFDPPINNIKRFFWSNERQNIIGHDGPRTTLSVSQWQDHSKTLSANLIAAGKDHEPQHIYRTGLNCSGRPGVTGMPVGRLYNPRDFFRWLAQNWMPAEMDEVKHPKGSRMGLVTLDFYDSAMDFVKFIIERNAGVELDRSDPLKKI